MLHLYSTLTSRGRCYMLNHTETPHPCLDFNSVLIQAMWCCNSSASRRLNSSILQHVDYLLTTSICDWTLVLSKYDCHNVAPVKEKSAKQGHSVHAEISTCIIEVFFLQSKWTLDIENHLSSSRLWMITVLTWPLTLKEVSNVCESTFICSTSRWVLQWILSEGLTPTGVHLCLSIFVCTSYHACIQLYVWSDQSQATLLLSSKCFKRAAQHIALAYSTKNGITIVWSAHT